ncbi:MAG: hypothetical protein Q8Q14_00595 [Gemmatimonadales bacterium]|nr:hypothetical protein [Gemmatimonadales bacterium]
MERIAIVLPCPHGDHHSKIGVQPLWELVRAGEPYPCGVCGRPIIVDVVVRTRAPSLKIVGEERPATITVQKLAMGSGAIQIVFVRGERAEPLDQP